MAEQVANGSSLHLKPSLAGHIVLSNVWLLKSAGSLANAIAWFLTLDKMGSDCLLVNHKLLEHHTLCYYEKCLRETKISFTSESNRVMNEDIKLPCPECGGQIINTRNVVQPYNDFDNYLGFRCSECKKH